MASQRQVLNEKEKSTPNNNSNKSRKSVKITASKAVLLKQKAKIAPLKGIPSRFSEKIKSSVVTSSLNSLRKIIILIRCAKMFLFRTKFRDLRFVNKKQIEMIHDETHFPEKKHNILFYQRFTEKKVGCFSSIKY